MLVKTFLLFFIFPFSFLTQYYILNTVLLDTVLLTLITRTYTLYAKRSTLS